MSYEEGDTEKAVSLWKEGLRFDPNNHSLADRVEFVAPSDSGILGDYGAGPNHTLPTGGSARYTGGLSVMNFLKVRTWIRIDDSAGASVLIEDARRLGEIEGLMGHAESARLRLQTKGEGCERRRRHL